MAVAVAIPRKKRKRAPRVALPILNSVDRAVIATDLEGKVVFWNAMAERLYGWTWKQAIGRQITELVVPPDGQPDAARIMKQLRNGKSWTGQFTVRRRDGTSFTATVRNEPIQDNDGHLVGIIGISGVDNAIESLKRAPKRRRGSFDRVNISGGKRA
ncbi:MAG TPA: PAS domain-containing protein [Chthoniobacterales bacterium]|nr:PAS domain-containing protein [Chthoniobacterales bacterium]